MRPWRILGVAVVGGTLLIGCQTSNEPTHQEAPASSSASAKNGATKAPERLSAQHSNRPDVSDNAFAGVDEAVAALAQATAEQNDNDRYQATEWLVMQGDAAVPPLTTQLAARPDDPRSHIVIARILGRIGTSAAARELARMATADNQLGAINAIQQLGAIQPSSRGIVNTLVQLMDHQDERRQLEAVKSLGKIGEDAAVAGDKLIALQNSQASDTLRQAARKSLEQVKPRKTLVDG